MQVDMTAWVSSLTDERYLPNFMDVCVTSGRSPGFGFYVIQITVVCGTLVLTSHQKKI